MKVPFFILLARMNEPLFQYQQLHPTTWAYLASLLAIALFFKFNRFWSVRNLDLVLLISLAPGLLFWHFGATTERAALRQLDTLKTVGEGLPRPEELPSGGSSLPPVPPPSETKTEPSGGTAAIADGTALPTDANDPVASAQATAAASRDPEHWRNKARQGQSLQAVGYLWLLGACGILLVRMLVDPTMVRRPMLDPNLTAGGLVFLGLSMFVFLMANVIASTPDDDDLQGPRKAALLLKGEPTEQGDARIQRHGPGYAMLYALPTFPTMGLRERQDNATAVQHHRGLVVAAMLMAVLSQAALVVGMVLVGYWHFDNIKIGVGAAALYLMLPYTALMTGHAEHSLMGALLTWAIAFYRRPLVAGIFVGLAMGAFYYPLFLLPLWLSFYWERGAMRFLVGIGSTLLVLVCTLALTSADAAGFWWQFRQMFGLWPPITENLQGVWRLAWSPWYRIPVLTAFAALCVTMAIWPAQKNLGTLLSCTAAVMLSVQFWHGFGGGLFMGWFLPLVLLTMFRPNLEDRVAQSVLSEGWFPRRRPHQRAAEKAA